MALKLTLKGFDSYLSDLKKAGADIDAAATEALTTSGEILTSAIKDSMKSSGMSDDTIRVMNRSLMQPTIYKNREGDTVTKIVCEVGFRLGDYDPKNPEGGYIALFNEYGTKERKTAAGKNRGHLEERAFIRRAIRKSKAKIKNVQKETLEKALQDALNL